MSLYPGGIMTEAAPLPVLRFRTQSALDRITREVAQLLDELFLIAPIAIVIARLPEMLGIADPVAKRLVATTSRHRPAPGVAPRLARGEPALA